MNASSNTTFTGTSFVNGHACGQILYTETELSFWGGIDPSTGEVIDRHHPLSGELLQGKILALPAGRGSCSGSGVILEMIVNGKGPDAIIVSRADDIISLGVLVAKEIFEQSIPVVMIEVDEFHTLGDQQFATIEDGIVHCSVLPLTVSSHSVEVSHLGDSSVLEQFTLTDGDRRLLNGEKGLAAQVAMKIILQIAKLMGAGELIDITQVHIDGCIYTGPASLRFAQKLRDMRGKVAVPTSLNAISVDYRRWKSQGVPSDYGEQASALADAYVGMGAKPTFTCAPYLLDSAPEQGEQIAWAESNAVVYANSVLGARTMKYPDFLDACIALTGRAPNAGPHIERNRRARVAIHLNDIDEVDDLFYPVLGYHVGKLAGGVIPVIDGLSHLKPDHDALKAFGAAFATVSSAPMFHIVGVTPDAAQLDDVLSLGSKVKNIDISLAELHQSWEELNQVKDRQSDLVSLGNPHFSLSEFEKLSLLCEGKEKAPSVNVFITAGRHVVEQAEQAGYLVSILDFGARIVTDTCWCMIEEPVLPTEAQVICTNSAKYAHYGPGMTGRVFKLLSLDHCVQEAISGSTTHSLPVWLSEKPCGI